MQWECLQNLWELASVTDEPSQQQPECHQMQVGHVRGYEVVKSYQVTSWPSSVPEGSLFSTRSSGCEHHCSQVWAWRFATLLKFLSFTLVDLSLSFSFLFNKVELFIHNQLCGLL